MLCCTLGCDKGTCGWCIAFVTSDFLRERRLRRFPGFTLLQPCVTASKRSRRVLPLVTMFMHLGRKPDFVPVNTCLTNLLHNPNCFRPGVPPPLSPNLPRGTCLHTLHSTPPHIASHTLNAHPRDPMEAEKELFASIMAPKKEGMRGTS